MTKDTCACKGAPRKTDKDTEHFLLKGFKRKREILKFKNETRA
jgi:hypothetical protein